MFTAVLYVSLLTVDIGYTFLPCVLFAECPSLSVRQLSQWLAFLPKCLLGLLPFYLYVCMCTRRRHYDLRSQRVLQILYPGLKWNWAEKKAFKYAAPSAWNDVQNHQMLSELITFGKIKILYGLYLMICVILLWV